MRDESQAIYAAIETDTLRLTNIIKENWKQGNFKKRRQKSLDNYELVPNLQRLAAQVAKQDVSTKVAGQGPGLIAEESAIDANPESDDEAGKTDALPLDTNESSDTESDQTDKDEETGLAD